MLSQVFSTIVATVGTVVAGPMGPLDVPDHQHLTDYRPPEASRVYRADGTLLAAFFYENRTFVHVDEMPPLLVQAFVSAEDQDFYTHLGIDYAATLRALASNVRFAATGSARLLGASTITQQVAKNLLLSPEVTIERKLREAILAVRLEADLEKNRILELYLNQIYFGQGAYGVAAAAVTYFGKRLDELTLAEAAYLAGLPKAPGYYHPHSRIDGALARRAYVLGRMTEDGAITPEQAEEANAEPLVAVLDSDRAILPPRRDYYAEEVRRTLFARYGQEGVLGGGLSVRVPLDAALQDTAERALRAGLVEYDRRHGWRGPVDRLSESLLHPATEAGSEALADAEAPPSIGLAEAPRSGLTLREALGRLGSGLIGRAPSPSEPVAAPDRRPAWQRALAELERPGGAGSWEMAVVLELDEREARIGLTDGSAGTVPLSEAVWARPQTPGGGLGRVPSRMADVVAPGDVILVEKVADLADDGTDVYGLRQVPEVQGAVVAMDQYSGRVLAVVGGLDFAASEFNRATQARRQPGSAFKPFVYLAALELGYLPNTLLLDTPVALVSTDAQEVWRPRNYDGGYLGLVPMRVGLERSRNLATVHLLREIGLSPVASAAERMGVYDDMPHYYSMALGAGVTTLLRLTSAYATIGNGGHRIEPTLIDRVQDSDGRTVYAHDRRACITCDGFGWIGQAAPELNAVYPPGNQVADPVPTFQLLSILQGVTVRGTGARLARLNLPLAGKTGTSNDSRDTWFIGFSPVVTVGVWVGFDDFRSLGRRETGSSAALPIFSRIMEEAMRGLELPAFVAPGGLEAVMIDRNTGVRVASGGIIEYFREGTDPEAAVSLWGAASVGAGGPSPLTGTGGLY